MGWLGSKNRGVSLIVIAMLFLLGNVFSALALDVNVANSKDWVDVYSIMLSSSQNNQRAIFVSSESLISLTRILSTDNSLNIYEADDDPFIGNLGGQLGSAGYNILDEQSSSEFNLDLDPENGNYFVVSRDNPRISVSLAPIAAQLGYWVFIVDEDTVGDVANRIDGANNVIAVGNFRRDILQEIEPSFTEWINNNDVFKDSQAIALKLGIKGNVVLADGQFLESEFFYTENPVILSGHNKIIEDTYEFLRTNEVQAVVVVGNELAVVGEQIRTMSNKGISVFVKFGQGDKLNTGKVFALTLYPLPVSQIALTVDKAVYNPIAEELIVYFRNPGNVGIYELTTLSVKDDGEELGSASSSGAEFLGAGETLPVKFKIKLPVEEITENTIVEFFTSFGLYPSQLDAFLTMENEFGPPFSIDLVVEEIEEDPSQLQITDVAYYAGLKRVGITITNPSADKVYFSAKINNLIVRGLETNLFKEDEIEAGETKVSYIPAELDKVDLQENKAFELTVVYGKDKTLLLNTFKESVPFRYEKGNTITGFVTGVMGESPTVAIIAIVVIIGVLLLGVRTFIKRRKRY